MKFALRHGASLVIVKGYTIVVAHNIYILYVVAEIKKTVFWKFSKKLGITCKCTAAIRTSCRNFNKWIRKDKLLLLVLQIYQKRKEWPFKEIYHVNNQKRKYFLIRKYHVTLARKRAVTYSTQIIVQLSFSKINSPVSAKSNLSGQAMAYNSSPTLDKHTWTDYVVFGKRQDRFRRLHWTKNDTKYFNFKLKVFKRENIN